MINDFYQTLFVIKRNAWTEDEDGNAFSGLAEVAQFMGHIQQASADLVESLGLTFTKSFSIWCPVDTNLEEGDILETVQGNYSVKAIKKFDIGSNKHIQAVVQLDEVAGS